jgi:Tfp pilus assembly protein PilF
MRALGILAAAFAASAVLAFGPTVEPTGQAFVASRCELDSTVSRDGEQRVLDLATVAATVDRAASMTIDYPRDESIFPPELLAPTFLWHDTTSGTEGWLIDVSFSGDPCRIRVVVPGDPPPRGEIDPLAISSTNEIYIPTPYQASARSWKPEPALWETIKRRSVEQPATLSFFGYRETQRVEILSRGQVTLSTSRDPVGAPIFYRDVPLAPSTPIEGPMPDGSPRKIMPLDKGAVPIINWRLRDLSRPASRVLLTDMPTCANCHSFSLDGKTLGMDIDGPDGDKGAYAIAPIEEEMVIEDRQIISWNSFPDKPQFHKTLGFLSRVHPTGEYVVSTVNEAIYIANFLDHEFGQVFYPTRGILAYYDRGTQEMKALPGADDPEFVHADAVWTPDGESLVLARATAREPYPEGRPAARYAGDPNETPIQYDLYRMPFDRGRGGTPEPIVGATHNGMSNNYPKVSPDGKWIVFVKCKNGQLMRPDSELWIVPAAGGEARRMRCNTSLMNSWHTFSPNSRWMAFSSKSNTPYTQMFLTHIDEHGNDSPAILVENSTAANRAVNIPEFVNISYDELTSIEVPAVEHYRHYNRGNTLAVDERHEEAIAEFTTALETSNESKIHDSLAKSLLNVGQNDRALQHLKESLRIDPYNYEAQSNAAFLLTERGEFDEALKHLNTAVRIHPTHAQGWYNRATLYLITKQRDLALDDYAQALRVQPRYPDALDGRGTVLRQMGDLEGARKDFDESIRIKAYSLRPWFLRAELRQQTGDLTGALDDLKRAREIVPPSSPRVAEIERLTAQVRRRLDEGR